MLQQSVTLDPYVSHGDDTGLETVENVHDEIGDFQPVVKGQVMGDENIDERIYHGLTAGVAASADAGHHQPVENHHHAHDEGKMDDFTVFLDAFRPHVGLDQEPENKSEIKDFGVKQREKEGKGRRKKEEKEDEEE